MTELWFPRVPSFESPADERRHRKERLAGAFRVFAKLGFEEGVAGHITARDPVEQETFWVNPFAVPFAHIRTSDLVRVDPEGRVVEGGYRVNRAAFAIHSQIHQARPDVIAAAHTHSPHGRALSALGEHLEPITQDACAFFGDHALFDDYTGIVTDTQEGKRIAHALGSNKAVILRNHGLLTVGHSVDAAAFWFIAMERSCMVQLLAKAAGTVVQIGQDQAAQTQKDIGFEHFGWLSFQPLWAKIVREQPDLLE
jgi:ribulose-5-phosphate 4-epimerase/fuculose-1-phosphate aldolase